MNVNSFTIIPIHKTMVIATGEAPILKKQKPIYIDILVFETTIFSKIGKRY